jgi:hypothetical protein
MFENPAFCFASAGITVLFLISPNINNMAYDTILFKCSGMIMNLFMQELQKGVYIPSVEGKTLYAFITEDCGISDEYISEKIKTILIDGGPVDDIFNTKIHDGGSCALSGAMPGIVGAMMRMGSPYAAMRDSITVKPDKTDSSKKEIKLGLKLFNMVLSDRGNDFLKRGVLIEKDRVLELFQRHGDALSSGCSEVGVNGAICGQKQLASGELKFTDKFVILKVEIDSEN